MNIRCSALPKIMACAQARHTPEVDIDEKSKPAELGTAVHEALACMVRGDRADLFAISEKYKCDFEEMKYLFYQGVNAWNEMASSLDSVVSVEKEYEVEGAGYKLTGHPDVIARDIEGRLVAVDWKSGRIESNFEKQLLGYLHLTAEPKDENFVAITIFLRQGHADIKEYVMEDIVDFEDELIDIMQSETYSPGDHCYFCDRQYECPAQTAMVQSTSLALSDGKFTDLTPAVVEEIHGKILIVDKMLKEYYKTLNALIEKSGTIPIGKGLELHMRDESRDKILFGHGSIQYLCDEIYKDDDAYKIIMDNLTISKKALRDAAAIIVPHGEKGKAKAEIIEKLRDAGAIKTTTFKKRETRKIIAKELTNGTHD